MQFPLERTIARTINYHPRILKQPAIVGQHRSHKERVERLLFRSQMRAVDASFLNDDRSHPKLAVTHGIEEGIPNLVAGLVELKLAANFQTLCQSVYCCLSGLRSFD